MTDSKAFFTGRGGSLNDYDAWRLKFLLCSNVLRWWRMEGKEKNSSFIGDNVSCAFVSLDKRWWMSIEIIGLGLDHWLSMKLYCHEATMNTIGQEQCIFTSGDLRVTRVAVDWFYAPDFYEQDNVSSNGGHVVEQMKDSQVQGPGNLMHR